jgi:hypothetical protein
VQPYFAILFGILLLSIVISSSLALVHIANASTSTDLEDEESEGEESEREEEDSEEQDFEEENSIQICCAWGKSLEDGRLTYYIDDDDTSEEQQQAVRNAVQEWDTKIKHLELKEESSRESSDIKIDFEDDDEEEIAGQTITIANAYGFLVNAEITIYTEVQEYEFDTTTIGQVAKHEMGHALGLGHANFDGNLMAEMVNYGTATVSECEINAVIEANYWKLGDNDEDDIGPDNPRYDSVTC